MQPSPQTTAKGGFETAQALLHAGWQQSHHFHVLNGCRCVCGGVGRVCCVCHSCRSMRTTSKRSSSQTAPLCCGMKGEFAHTHTGKGSALCVTKAASRSARCRTTWRASTVGQRLLWQPCCRHVRSTPAVPDGARQSICTNCCLAHLALPFVTCDGFLLHAPLF